MRKIINLLRKDKHGDAVIFFILFLILIFGMMTIYYSKVVELSTKRAQLSNTVATAALKAKWEGIWSHEGDIDEEDEAKYTIEGKNLYFDKDRAIESVVSALRADGFVPLNVDAYIDDNYLYIEGDAAVPNVSLTPGRTTIIHFRDSVRLYKNYSK